MTNTNDSYKEVLRLRKEIEELEKENCFLKNRKASYYKNKQKRLQLITEIYHKYDGKPGYRMIKELDRDNQLGCSKNTIHRYMKELGLKSIIVKKKPTTVK